MKGLAATKLPLPPAGGLGEGLFRSPPPPETAPGFPREPRTTSPAIAPSPESLGMNRNDFEPIWIRSEEHTSELQSLMRISYAVFCLKKKKNKDTTIKQLT